MAKLNELLEEKITYNAVDDKDALLLMEVIRNGIKFTIFLSIAKNSPFSLNEWSAFLHISERTMQRYKKEKKTFDVLHSEKIIQIILLYRLGEQVFGNKQYFTSWLETENVSLGSVKPKALLDNSFGINLIKDELTRIEYGVLA